MCCGDEYNKEVKVKRICMKHWERVRGDKIKRYLIEFGPASCCKVARDFDTDFTVTYRTMRKLRTLGEIKMTGSGSHCVWNVIT